MNLWEWEQYSILAYWEGVHGAIATLVKGVTLCAQFEYDLPVAYLCSFMTSKLVTNYELLRGHI